VIVGELLTNHIFQTAAANAGTRGIGFGGVQGSGRYRTRTCDLAGVIRLK